MEPLFATAVITTLSFSLLWLNEQQRFGETSERVASTYEAQGFPDQTRSSRDRIFKLFPLAPAPLLFAKLAVLENLLSDWALYRSGKYLGSLLIGILFGFVIVSIGAGNPNLRGLDAFTLEITLFGCAFFLARSLRVKGASARGGFSPGAPSARRFPGMAIFFAIFAVLLPLLLWLMSPPVSPPVDATQAKMAVTSAALVKHGADDIGRRLVWAFQFLRIFSLFMPVVLYLFDIGEGRVRIEREVFDDQDVGLNSVTRIKNIIAVLASMIGALVVMNVDLSSLSLFSGLVAAGLSVALRESITNFFSGLQMSWDGSLKIGDVISIPEGVSSDTGSTYGIVRDIRSRYTVVEDRNTVRRLVPNSRMVSDTIEHWTHEDRSVRLSLRVGIPYLQEPRLVRQAQRIMESVCYDVPRVLTNKPPNALLVRYDDSQLTFSLRFWIDDAQNGIRPVISEVLISLYERLSDAGIKIPVPQRDIHIKELPFDWGGVTLPVAPPVFTAEQGGKDD
jgi:small-conductance mechanosensitive channel